MLAALYGLLALAMYLGTQLATRWGHAAGLVFSAGAAFFLTLHLREQTRPGGVTSSLNELPVLVSFVGVCLVVCLLYYLATYAFAAPREWRRLGAWTLIAVTGFFVLLATFYFSSNVFRWHLLRHNRLLGAFSYHLLAEDTASVKDALWKEHEMADAATIVPAHHEAPAEAGQGEEVQLLPQPNIVLIVVDTLRADALAGYGGAPGLMPHLNAFASESQVFVDVKANSSWTGPSMASLFTGLLPEEHGAVQGSPLGPDNVTLPEALQLRGYRTVGFVSNGAVIRADRGMAQGFEEFHQLDTRGGSYPPYPPAEVVNEAVFRWLRKAFAVEPDSDTKTDQPSQDETVAQVHRPLFLYIHYLDPHTPYLSGGDANPVRHSDAIAAYEAELRYLDTELHATLDVLAEQLEGPTHTLITSDHGEEFGEHGERGHGRTLYDEVLAIPALLNLGAGGTRGEIDAKLEARDFYDLLIRLANSDDLDVGAWARGKGRSERYSSVYTSRPDLGFANLLLRPHRVEACLRLIETDGYTLIWSGQGNTYELYDLRNDPAQLDNIAADEPDVVERLRAVLESAVSYWSPRIIQAPSEEELERLRALGYIR